MGPYDIILFNMKAREAHENVKQIKCHYIVSAENEFSSFSTHIAITTLLFKKFFRIPTIYPLRQWVSQ